MTVSKAEQARRVNYHYMADAMRMLEWDLHNTVLTRLRIPEEWHAIARDRGTRPRKRVTISLDEDVVKFFQSMGKDWQPRVNRVLESYVHARLAGLIRGPETMDYLKRTGEDAMDFDDPRPMWGDEHRMMEPVLGEDAAWRGSGPGVPLGKESETDGVVRAKGRVMIAKAQVEREGW